MNHLNPNVPQPTMIIVVGRGHGGTRTIAKTLAESGVFMGQLNDSYDHMPRTVDAAYDACKLVSQRIPWPWDFTKLGEPTVEFKSLIAQYLHAHSRVKNRVKGWKLPENTLMYPWLVKMFPEAHFIHWIRNPLDSIRDYHLTDDLSRFDATTPPRLDLNDLRYYSWLYQESIIAATPRPRHYHPVWFENFVLKQEEALIDLEVFLNMPLARVPVDQDAAARYATEKHMPRVFRTSKLASGLLSGLKGVEIGASAHNPFDLHTVNVDSHQPTMETVFGAEQHRICGSIAPVDVIADGDKLPFEDKSYDFVISSHAIEHFYDPIGAIKEWIRVSRRYVFMVVPHVDRTFDKGRPLTTVAELVARHEGTERPTENKHWSVWNTASFLELMKHLKLPVAAYQDKDDKVGNGFTVVIGDLLVDPR